MQLKREAKSKIGTDCLYRLKNKQQTLSDIVNFITTPVVFFRGVELTFFVNSFISCGMTSPNIIYASDFAIRKVSFNPHVDRLSVMNLRSPGSVARETISVKVKYRFPFSEPIQQSVRGNRVH